MPIITVYEGPRSAELKRELIRQLTDAMTNALTIPADAVQVWIHDVPADSWGIGGTSTADKK